MSRSKPGLLTRVRDCGNLQAGSALIPGATGRSARGGSRRHRFGSAVYGDFCQDS